MNTTTDGVKQRPILIGSHIQQRVFFVGPFGVGKTTALRTISDTPVVSTEEHSHESLVNTPNKTTTTVGFDYGEWHLPSGEPIGLYGLPGQSRFNAMWDTLIVRNSVLVLWLFGDQKDSLTEAEQWLNFLAQRHDMHNIVVAVTRLKEPIRDAELQAYRQLVQPHHPWMPVISADPRRPSDVIQAIAIALNNVARR